MTTAACFVLPPMERYSASTGGAIATVTRQLVRALERRGCHSSVFTPADGAPPYAEGRVVALDYGPARPGPASLRKGLAVEARLHRWSCPDYGRYLRSVRLAFSSLPQAPDLVVVANDPEMAARLHRLSGATVVLWLHNFIAGWDLAQLPPSVVVVAVSDAVRRWTVEHHGLPADRVAVLHNGVDPEEFKPREGFTEPVLPVRVISHGRIDPNKGHDVAARAVAVLRERGLPVTFTLVGGVQTFGIGADEVAAFEARLDRAVAFAQGERLGRIPASEVAGVLRCHDVACALSRVDDPFPLAALEAMASGCALVTSGRGGLAEMVGDLGMVVSPDDFDAVVDTIGRLVTDPESLRAAKQLSLDRAASFSWDDTATQLVGVVAPTQLAEAIP